MPGYYKRPDLTAQAIVGGWLHTGDLGYVDEDGFLYLVDRKKDMIISGGTNVFPKDIEEIIVQHPAVREVAVFGIPSEKWGETPLAAVILHQPGAITAEALRDWINERVDAKNQRVSAVAIMEDFPRSTAGKTLKRTLREPYWAGRNEKMSESGNSAQALVESRLGIGTSPYTDFPRQSPADISARPPSARVRHVRLESEVISLRSLRNCLCRSCICRAEGGCGTFGCRASGFVHRRCGSSLRMAQITFHKPDEPPASFQI